MFDLDDYLAACEKPAVKLYGKIHTGRLLSVEQAGKFADRWAALMKDETLTKTDPALFAFEKDYFYTVFPKSSIPWHFDVAAEVMKFPPNAAFDLLLDFFRVSRQEPKPTPSRDS